MRTPDAGRRTVIKTTKGGRRTEIRTRNPDGRPNARARKTTDGRRTDGHTLGSNTKRDHGRTPDTVIATPLGSKKPTADAGRTPAANDIGRILDATCKESHSNDHLTRTTCHEIEANMGRNHTKFVGGEEEGGGSMEAPK